MRLALRHTSSFLHCIEQSKIEILIQISSFRNSFLFLALWHLAPLIRQMEHGVARYGVAPHLGTSLRVDGIGGVGELMQEVESLGFEDPFALAEGAGERVVPHPAVAV